MNKFAAAIDGIIATVVAVVVSVTAKFVDVAGVMDLLELFVPLIPTIMLN